MLEHSSEMLKIGDFARRAQTNLRTLRYYEELGLLAPAARSQGGFRYYRPSDVNRLNMIRDLQGLGLPLERIRELLATRGDEGSREKYLERVREALLAQDQILVERVHGLQKQRAQIRLALTKIDECDTCPHTPCAANNRCEPCSVTGKPLPAPVSALF